MLPATICKRYESICHFIDVLLFATDRFGIVQCLQGLLVKWLAIKASMYSNMTITMYSRTSISGRGDGENTQKAPAYRMIPLNVAHSACETKENALKTSPL
jgi:hypothetical protein